MEPTNEQLKQLHQALMSAFPDQPSLEIMIRFELGENLSEIAGGNDLREITFNLLFKWAVPRGCVEKLIRGALKDNPGNPQLKGVASQLLPAEEYQKEDGHISDAVRDTLQMAEEQRLKQITTSIPSSQRTSLKEEINQAETWISEGNHQQAAEAFEHIAMVLAQSYNLAQARHYAVKAAEQYLQSNNQMSAAERYLQSAEFCLESTFSAQPAIDALEKARRLAENLDAPELQSRVLFTFSRAAFANLDDTKAMHYLEKASEVAINCLDHGERRSLLLCNLALWHASQATIREEWEDAWNVLNISTKVFRDAPLENKIEIIQMRLRVSSRLCEWQLADSAYEEGQKLLDTPDAQRERGGIMVDYAASLARRGDLQRALEIYQAAIEELEDVDDPYVLSLAYQNMLHMLNQNGMFFIRGNDDRRRIDLFNRTQIENKGYNHQRRAAENIGSQKHREALQDIRLSLIHYWRDGDWLGIQEVYQLLARLHAETGDLVNAFSASLYTGDIKAVEHHSEKLLRTVNDKQVFYNIVQSLTTLNAAASEQSVSAKALAILADVIPPDLLNAVVGYLRALLQIPEDNDVRVKVRKHAAEALGNIVAQVNPKQVNQIIRLVLEQLSRDQFWTVIEKLLRVLGVCFSQRADVIEANLYAHVYETVSQLELNDPLPSKMRAVLVDLARHANDDVHIRVIDYLRQTEDESERLGYLAFLQEPVPEDSLTNVVERILQAANITPTITQKGSSQVIHFGIGSISPRKLRLFTGLLSSDLQSRVTDGLLEAIINDHNYLYLRVEAIWALSELPNEMLTHRAEEITEYLLWGAKGDLPQSSDLDLIEQLNNPFSNFWMNMGSTSQVQLSSLRCLGRLYRHIPLEQQGEITETFFSASRDKESTVRQGVAMALKAIETDEPLHTRLLLSLVGLMHDVDHTARGWACAACGHLIAKGSAAILASELLEYLVDSANAQETEVRVGSAIGLATTIDSERINEEQRERISRTLSVLSDDVSFRVRREAISYKT